jgi:hypothetical protein
VKLDEYLITHFARKSLIGFMRFDLVEHFGGIQVLLLKNEGLTYQIISSVPQVFGGKRGGVNLGVTGIAFADDVLFDEPHVSSTCLTMVAAFNFAGAGRLAWRRASK